MMYAEIIKLRRTPFFWCHLLFPVAGAVVFGYYFTSYVTQSETNRFRLILEITATIFPILASVMTGIVVAPEEATGFYTILSEEKRGRAILTKLLFLWGMGALALLLLAACFAFHKGWWIWNILFCIVWHGSLCGNTLCVPSVFEPEMGHRDLGVFRRI